MTIVEQIAKNRQRTYLLFFGFFFIYSALGFAAYLMFGDLGIILIAAVAIGLVISSLFFGDDMAVKVAGGQQIKSRDEAPLLWDLVETMAITAGIQMPRVFISPDPTPNAFAAGRNENQALVCVNVGLLNLLDKQELEGVIAHEVAHIQNKDVQLMTYVAVLAGSIALLSYLISRSFLFSNNNSNIFAVLIALLAVILAPLAATIIQMAISRKREFLADAQAADLTRYPQGLASALEKISMRPLGKKEQGKEATAHMYISPLALEQKGAFSKMFSTHPPTEERVERLLDLASGVRHSPQQAPDPTKSI
jgi:heat shock protein HtpX